MDQTKIGDSKEKISIRNTDSTMTAENLDWLLSEPDLNSTIAYSNNETKISEISSTTSHSVKELVEEQKSHDRSFSILKCLLSGKVFIGNQKMSENDVIEPKDSQTETHTDANTVPLETSTSYSNQSSKEYESTLKYTVHYHFKYPKSRIVELIPSENMQRVKPVKLLLRKKDKILVLIVEQQQLLYAPDLSKESKWKALRKPRCMTFLEKYGPNYKLYCHRGTQTYKKRSKLKRLLHYIRKSAPRDIMPGFNPEISRIGENDKNIQVNVSS